MNAMNEIGYGARAKGMGGVAVAFPQDSFTPIANPATLLQLGCRLDLGIGAVIQYGGTQEVDPGGQVVPGTEFRSNQPLFEPEVGAVWQLSPCQALGLALYVVGALDVDYRAPLPSLAAPGSTSPTSLRTTTAALTPSWAIRLTPVHTVGIGLNLLLTTLEIRGVGQFANAADSAFPSDVTNRGVDTAVGLSIRGGWTLCIRPNFQLGLSLQSKSWSQKLRKYRGFLADEGAFNTPARVDLGVSWWILPQVAIAADYSLNWWSRIRSFGNRGQGEGGNFGDSLGPGFGWNGQSIVRVGALWCPCQRYTFRIGMNVGINPIDATESELNQLTLAQPEAHVTLGMTRKCRCRGEWSGYYYYVFRRRVTGRNSDITGGVNNFDLRNTQNGVGVSYSYCF